MEMKPLHQIELLKKEVERLKFRCNFYEEEKKRDVDTITELKFELIKLQDQHKQLQRETLALRQQNGDHGQFDIVDLNSDDDDDDGDFEVPMLVEMPPHAHAMSLLSKTEALHCCQFCSKRFIRGKCLRNHIEKSHQAERMIPTAQHSMNRCNEPGCNFKTAHVPSFRRHRKSHSMETITCPCPGCEYNTKYMKRLINHVAKVHREHLEVDMLNYQNHGITE